MENFKEAWEDLEMVSESSTCTMIYFVIFPILYHIFNLSAILVYLHIKSSSLVFLTVISGSELYSKRS